MNMANKNFHLQRDEYELCVTTLSICRPLILLYYISGLGWIIFPADRKIIANSTLHLRLM